MLSGHSVQVGSNLGWCAAQGNQLKTALAANKATMLPGAPGSAKLVQDLIDAMAAPVAALEAQAAAYLEASQDV